MELFPTHLEKPEPIWTGVLVGFFRHPETEEEYQRKARLSLKFRENNDFSQEENNLGLETVAWFIKIADDF